MGNVLKVFLAAIVTANVWSQGSAYFPPNSSSLTRIRVVDSAPNRIDAVPGAYQITGGNITVEAWVLPVELPASGLQQVIVRRPSSNGFLSDPYSTYSLHLQNNGLNTRFVFEVTDGVSSSINPHVLVEDTTDVVLDTWCHVAGTYDGSVGKLYVNGQLAATDTFSVSMSAGSTGLYVGGTSGTSFEGLIDEVRLWNVTRSGAEILATKDTILVGDEAGLAGYWRFDEATGATIARDQTSNHNDLNVQNGATFVQAVFDQPVHFAAHNLPGEITVNVGEIYSVNMICSGYPDVTSVNVAGPAGLVWTPTGPNQGVLDWSPLSPGENSVVITMNSSAGSILDTVLFRAVDPLNMVFESNQNFYNPNKDFSNTYANIWGYTDSQGREYAVMGTISGTAIIDVTDPQNPVEVDTVTAPISAWHEEQVWQNYAYSVSEGGSGLQIINLSLLPDSVFLVKNWLWTGSNADRAHAFHIRDGYAYLTGGTVSAGQGGNQGGIRIVSLADPENPVTVGFWDSLYVHDCYVRNDTIYAACIFDGVMAIIDATDKANPRTIYAYTWPNAFTHNAALTDDGQYLLTTDETSNPPGKLRIWDISTLRDGIAGNTNVEEVASFGSTGIVHNVYVKGHHAFASYYSEGVRVWNIQNPKNPIVVGHYDSYPADNAANFNGDWGVYPFFEFDSVNNKQKLILSDRQRGLIVLSFSPPNVGFVRGTITDRVTGQPILGATVQFVGKTYSVTTGSDGNYVLNEIYGPVTLSVSKTGYATMTVNLDINVPDVTIDLDPVRSSVEPPTSVTAVITDTAIGRVQVNWAASVTGGVAEYVIYRSTTSISDTAGLRYQMVGNVTSFLDTLESSGSYFYKIAARYGSGLLSAPSNEANVAWNSSTVVHFPPRIRTTILQNPAATRHADIVVTSLDSLEGAPLVRIKSGTDSSVVPMSAVTAGLVYRGPVTFTSAGTYSIHTEATSVYQVDSIADRSFAVVLTKPRGTTVIQTPSGNAILKIQEGTFADETHLTAMDDGSSVHFGPDVVPARSVGLELKLNVATHEDPAKFFIFQRSGDDWIRVPTLRLTRLGILKADAETLGEFKVEYDPSYSGENVEITDFALAQNYPNPFNPVTTLRYDVPLDAHIEFAIYNTLGQKVRTLVSGFQPAGRYQFQWDSRNDAGAIVASGVYLYRLHAGSFVKTRKMLLVK